MNQQQRRHGAAAGSQTALRQDKPAGGETCIAPCPSHQQCGVLPAVIVMETPPRLNHLSRSHRVGYATSANVTRDTTRVVGYAGLRLG